MKAYRRPRPPLGYARRDEVAPRVVEQMKRQNTVVNLVIIAVVALTAGFVLWPQIQERIGLTSALTPQTDPTAIVRRQAPVSAPAQAPALPTPIPGIVPADQSEAVYQATAGAMLGQQPAEATPAPNVEPSMPADNPGYDAAAEPGCDAACAGESARLAHELKVEQQVKDLYTYTPRTANLEPSKPGDNPGFDASVEPGASK